MLFALIDPTQASLVIDVVADVFVVPSPYYFVECSEDVLAHRFSYSPITGVFSDLYQPTTVGTISTFIFE